MLALLLPSASFCAVSTMVDNLSSSGMDRITGEVEALRRLLRGRIGSCHSNSTFALCFIDGLSFAEEAVTSAIHRMRGRFRALMHEEIARTVATPGEVGPEIRHLLRVLSGAT